MDVTFDGPARYNFAADAVCFDATVGSQRVVCVVPFEELHRLSDGAVALGEADYLGVFGAHRRRVEDLARTLLAREGVPSPGLNGRELTVTTEPAQRAGPAC